MALLEELDTLESQLEAAKGHADVTAAHAQAAEQHAATLQGELDLAAGRVTVAEGRLVELQGRLEAALVKAEAADVGVGRRTRGLMQVCWRVVSAAMRCGVGGASVMGYSSFIPESREELIWLEGLSGLKAGNKYRQRPPGLGSTALPW